MRDGCGQAKYFMYDFSARQVRLGLALVAPPMTLPLPHWLCDDHSEGNVKILACATQAGFTVVSHSFGVKAT